MPYPKNLQSVASIRIGADAVLDLVPEEICNAPYMILKTWRRTVSGRWVFMGDAPLRRPLLALEAFHAEARSHYLEQARLR